MTKINKEVLASTDETVTIAKEYFNQLLDDALWRRALEAGGVDNWEYYGDALIDAGYYDDEDEED